MPNRITLRPTPKPWWEKAKGFVYVIKSSTGLFKIGHANDVWRRFDQHRHDYPGETLDMVSVIEADNRYECEKFLHKRFSAKRVRGEWFDLAPDDVACLVDLSARPFKSGLKHKA